KLFVGNVAWGTTDDEVKELFAQYGEIQDIYFPKDPAGRTKGYGFIEMDDQEADKVIQEVNGLEFNGRELRIDAANPR
ncbi:RNP-1 like RNA-binding protein, partial [Gamsiella multidivaricata]|uniref:RNP-1 like RNA-binding protein n=1 Tax=Gamsiella multidivaricata TaxID=101098 RepID=UPI00221F65F1